MRQSVFPNSSIFHEGKIHHASKLVHFLELLVTHVGLPLNVCLPVSEWGK